MANIVIKEHDFQKSKNSIKKFSNDIPKEVELDEVRSKKGFKEFLLSDNSKGHKVTGEEFNDRLDQIRNNFISANETQIKMIKQFGEVYNALEALDKDYIQAILISIKATEKTSEAIKNTQDRIEIIVNDQIKTIEVLKKFKSKIDEIKHIDDIDDIWSDYKNWHDDMISLSACVDQLVAEKEANASSIKEVLSKLITYDDQLTNLNSNLRATTQKLESVINSVKSVEESNEITLRKFNDLDSAVERISVSMNEIESDMSLKIVDINDSIVKYNESTLQRINDLDSSVETLSLSINEIESGLSSKFDDINILVNDLESNSLKKEASLNATIESVKLKVSESEKSIKMCEDNWNLLINEIKKTTLRKIYWAYGIAGGSLVISIALLVEMFLR